MTLEDSIMTAGARLAPEPSRALPVAAYRDPALSVELVGEKANPRKHRPPKVSKELLASPPLAHVVENTYSYHIATRRLFCHDTLKKT